MFSMGSPFLPIQATTWRGSLARRQQKAADSQSTALISVSSNALRVVTWLSQAVGTRVPTAHLGASPCVLGAKAAAERVCDTQQAVLKRSTRPSWRGALLLHWCFVRSAWHIYAHHGLLPGVWYQTKAIISRYMERVNSGVGSVTHLGQALERRIQATGESSRERVGPSEASALRTRPIPAGTCRESVVEHRWRRG